MEKLITKYGMNQEEIAVFLMYRLRLEDIDDYLNNKANDSLKLKMMKIFQKYPELTGYDFPDNGRKD
jgi:hypothetical protein